MNDAPAFLRTRFVALWPLKLVGMTVGMTAFFAAYFWLLDHPRHPPVIMPFTAVDRWIGFSPAALPLYLSLWIYVSLAPALMLTWRELAAYGAAALALSVAGLGIFFLWPTAVPPPGVTWADDSLVAFLKHADASGNACPSLHVAFAVLTALVLRRLMRSWPRAHLLGALNWLWCAGILYSTLATRQHVALDVAAGAFLGAAIGAAYTVVIRR